MTEGLMRHKTVIPAALSSEPSLARREEPVREFLAFAMATESYALPLGAIREILKPPPITEVPRAPRDVLGIISVRGRITTVVDLRRRLRLPEGTPDKHTRVLLVDSGTEIMGLLVDRVMQVYRLAEDEVELAAVVAGDMSEYFLGIGRPRVSRLGRERDEARDELLILLNPVPLLRK
jgi:purine-binding chemotaxis protein CheW